MIHLFRSLLLGGLLVSTTVQGSPVDKLKNMFSNVEQVNSPTLKVLLETGIDGAMIQVTGGYNIYDPYTGKRLATRFNGKAAFLQPVYEGIRWGEMFPNTYQIEIVPDHKNSTILVNGQQYRGSLLVYQVEGEINLINEVSIEDYTVSRLANHLDVELSNEALAAVAIVARTEAQHAIENPKNKFWHVRSVDTGYNGYGSTYKNPAIAEAVKQTEHMVMTVPYNGKLSSFVAQWTKNSAGHTAAYNAMYRHEAAPELRGVTAPFAAQARKDSQWTATVDKMTLARLVGLDHVEKVGLNKDRSSGKVVGIQLRSKQFGKEIDFVSLQEKLGEQKLKSSDFTVTDNGATVTFAGVGEGNGVGLCLYSAEKMAQRGQNAAEILDSFFPTASLKRVASPVASEKQIADKPKKPMRHYM